jgi:2-polyprenyl-3-methyl-5-hydroxy-6-metoxy-1,4-benzoquinol methylase
VSQVGLSIEQLTVRDDSQDFYGREYWFSHQELDLGFANITSRARLDLSERCLHWLRAVLKYKLPEGKALELGSAHGGFVALLQQAGFEATGLELSAWVVDFARKTFDVPMLLGPIEDQQIELGTLNVIAFMDVLEHLPDPVSTMRRCLELLKPDGVLVIQTPCCPRDTTYDTMLATGSPFLDQLKSNEHLYLYSQASVRKLFQDLKAEHLVFEPAIFGHYDMFFVVSRQPLAINTSQAIEEALSHSVSGRMVQALLDKAAEVDQLRTQLARTAALQADVEYLKEQINVIESHQIAQLQHFNTQMAANEADRAARLEVIERQGAELDRIPALEADVAYLKAQISSAEVDRAARLAVIERQGDELGQLQHTLAQTLQRMESVHNLLGANKLKYLSGILPARWERIQQLLQAPISSVSTNNHVPSPEATPDPIEHRPLDQPERPALEAYVATISEFNSTQTNAALLDSIRLFNHTIIETLDGMRPLRDKRLLDIGASPHGYALERALALGVAEYVGVGLDVEQSIEVQSDTGLGRLLYMNAEQLDFPDHSFDLVISLSTFEHVGDVPRVLTEIRRVLRPGGSALITFEPIWTCAYGHHLHHFGPVSELVPDWAHLLWDKDRMRQELAPVWPADAPISLEETVSWTYDSQAINRVGITQMRECFKQSGLAIEWIVPLQAEARDPERLRLVAAATALAPDDLITKGLSVLLNRS